MKVIRVHAPGAEARRLLEARQTAGKVLLIP